MWKLRRRAIWLNSLIIMLWPIALLFHQVSSRKRVDSLTLICKRRGRLFRCRRRMIGGLILLLICLRFIRSIGRFHKLILTKWLIGMRWYTKIRNAATHFSTIRNFQSSEKVRGVYYNLERALSKETLRSYQSPRAQFSRVSAGMRIDLVRKTTIKLKWKIWIKSWKIWQMRHRS